MNAESVLFVPGSWHGGWVYDEVADRLTRAGVAAKAIDLPSNGGEAGLADDAAAVRQALDGIGEPTVVVGHSYGGIAVSEGAAEAPQAVGLVYLAAFMLDVGESLLDAMQHQLPDWISLDQAAGSHIAQRSEEVLYGDCSPEVADNAAARLTRQSVRGDRDAADGCRVAEPAEHVPDLRRGPRRPAARAGGDGCSRGHGAPRPRVALPVLLAPRRRLRGRAAGAGPLTPLSPPARPEPRCGRCRPPGAHAAGRPMRGFRARRRAPRPSTR